MKIPHIVLETQTLCFSSYKNHKLKVKLWWVSARKRKKSAFFVPFILSERIFFNICVLSQCIVYWIHFQKIHTFTYQKTLLHTLFCLYLKSSKAFSVSSKIKNSTYHSRVWSPNLLKARPQMVKRVWSIRVLQGPKNKPLFLHHLLY